MNPFIPTPDALPIPAPAPLFTYLLHLVFVVHLLTMNFLLGGGLMMVAAMIRRQHTGDDHDRFLARLTKLMPTLVSATVSTGVAPLLFMQVLYGNFFYSSSIIMAWPWFSLVLVLIAAYYLLYINSFKTKVIGRARPLVVGTAVAILLYIAFLNTNNTTLMLTPERWADMYFKAPGGTSFNLDEPMLWPRYLHMVLGALAIAGLWTAWLGRWEKMDAALSKFMTQHGLSVFAIGTMVNVIGGVGYLFGLKRDVRMLLIGDDPHLTGLMGAGIVLTMAMIILAFRSRARQGSGLGWLSGVTVVTMVDMVLMRHGVRDAYLVGAYQPKTFEVQSQWLNIGIFGVLLVGGVATIVWMVRKLLAPQD